MTMPSFEEEMAVATTAEASKVLGYGARILEVLEELVSDEEIPNRLMVAAVLQMAWAMTSSVEESVSAFGGQVPTE